MKDELDILQDVSARLDDARIPFMLTGSVAMNFYASPRMTRDLDIVIFAVPAQSLVLARVFEADYYISSEAVHESIRQSTMFNVVHYESVIKVDFIVRKESPYRSVEFERRQRVTIRNFKTWIVSKEDLILSKLDWARESRSDRQLGDVRNLLSAGCDLPYVEHWASQLGLQDLLKGCIDE